MNGNDINRFRIQQILPHRSPFLFVDDILEFNAGHSIITRRFISPQEVYFKGHFPGRPLMPGVLITEALAQTSGLLLGLTLWQEASVEAPLPEFVLTTIDLKFSLPVDPGQTLHMASELTKEFGGIYRFRVSASVDEQIVAKGILSLGGAT